MSPLLAQGDDELTLTFVKQALLDEEQRQSKSVGSSTASDSGSSDSVLKAARGFSKGRKPGNFYICGKAGHYAKECRMRFDKGSQLKVVKYSAKKVEEIQEDSDSGGAQEDSDSGAQLFAATTGLRAEAQKDKWIIDSGASRHMTFQEDILRDYKEFETPKNVGSVMDQRRLVTIRVIKFLTL